MTSLHIKDGCSWDGLSEAGARIKAVIEECCDVLGCDLTVTCTTGSHGPDDPHTHGNALDVRTRDLDGPMKQALLECARDKLGPQFYCQLETATTQGATAPHLHCQLRRATVYDPSV